MLRYPDSLLRAGAALVWLSAIVAPVSPTLASHDQNHPGLCGPADRLYACGQIIVILQPKPTSDIRLVIERMGGDPASDLAAQFMSVRDLLDPDGVADDLSPATGYVVLVEVGSEENSAAQYAADPAVYAAGVDRETIGTTTPDTAMPTGGGPNTWLTVATCIGLSVLTFMLGKKRLDASRRTT